MILTGIGVLHTYSSLLHLSSKMAVKDAASMVATSRLYKHISVNWGALVSLKNRNLTIEVYKKLQRIIFQLFRLNRERRIPLPLEFFTSKGGADGVKNIVFSRLW